MAKNILGIILLAAGLAVGVFWGYPLWLEVEQARGYRNELTKTVNRIKELGRIRDNLLAEYNSISREDIESLEEFFPKNPESGLLLINLDSLANANGFILKDISLSEGQNQAQSRGAALTMQKFESLPFKITASGSYQNFRIFLDALEKSRRLIDLDEISFDSGKAGARDFYEFGITAHTYWKK